MDDTPAIRELRQLATLLGAAEPPPAGLATTWTEAHRLLRRAGADPLRSGRAVAERNVTALLRLIDEAAAGGGGAKAPRPMITPQAMAAAQAALNPPAPPPPARPTPPAAPTTPPPSMTVGPGAPPVYEPGHLKSALKAFKRRLKVTRADAESKLSSRALTGGQHSGIVAIQPPAEYPRELWDELARLGHLKRVGSGLYQFVKD